MKNYKKLMSFILTLALSLGLTSSLIACTPENTFDGTLNTEIIDSEHIKLVSSDVVVNSEEGYLEKTLTATVLPEYLTESEKKVDWYVVWGEPTNKNISDYLTVIPQGDGGNVCSVRCYSAFDITAVVYVKTRIGGYTARCFVEYIGIPTELKISTSASVKFDESISKNIYEINEGSSITFDIETDNILGNTSKYTPNYSVKVKTFGLINFTGYAGDYIVDDLSGFINVHPSYNYDVFIENGYDYMGQTHYLYEYFNYELNNNSLIINATTAVEGLKLAIEYYDYEIRDLYQNDCVFKNYGEFIPYIEIIVTETGANVSQSFFVRVLSLVDSVFMDNSNIIF